MQLPDSLFALILLHLASPIVAAESQWPHNLPRHMKYFPEDEVHVKRGLSIQEKLQREKPIGMKKMSEDEGEMFFLDNWIFASDLEAQERSKRSELEVFRNGSIPLLSPLRPHSEQNLRDSILRFAIRDRLIGREFKCPEGTNDCSSIGAPDSCCGSGSTCINVDDTGYGSVGCCQNGQECAGSISCDEENGYTSCPDSPNGGCCLPGYSCQDVGCVVAGTSVTYVQPSTSRQRESSTAVVVPTTTSASPTPTSSYTCSSGWFSCPANVGGGCCQNGRECATGASCVATETSTESSQAPSAPVRPTSNDASSSSSSSESTTTGGSPPDLCPNGFYVCSAYYPSGCCRVGRDCQTTGTCVETNSGVIVSTNGVVIIAPSGASVATTAKPQGGSCPSAWFSCAASLGGNCCPNGFECGEACTATSGTAVTDKVSPSTASVFSYTSIWAAISGAIAIGIAMIVL